MKRRVFIKNTLCLGCMGVFASGCNNIINNTRLEQEKFKYKSKADLPRKIHLEACSLCQLNCPACGPRQVEKRAPKGWSGYLKFSDFKNFVDDNEFEEIFLSNSGEIFLNPELDEIIKYAHKKGIKLDASANLNTVSDKTLENMVKYKFSRLRIALDAACDKTYSLYRKGGDFNKVINNIKKINYYKEKHNSEFPKLTYQFIVFGHNEHEIEAAKKKAAELNMKISFKKNYAPRYSPLKNPKLVEKQTGLKILGKNNKVMGVECKTRNSVICNYLFETPQIDYNGDLLGCCRASIYNFGVNVFKEGLLNALNSPNVLYAKLMLSDSSTPPKEGIPCTYCDDNVLIL